MSSVVKSKLVRATAITVSIALFRHAGLVLVATCAIALSRVSVAIVIAVCPSTLVVFGGCLRRLVAQIV